MNIRDKKIKIRFQNGEIRTLRPVEPDIVPLKKYFKRHTGIRYNFKHRYFLTQVVNSLKKWLDKYGLHHPAAPGLIVAAEGIIASEQRRFSDGFVAFTEEDEECLLVIFPPDGYDYVWRISKMLYDEISGKEINIDERIVGVELLEDEPPTAEELEVELAEALKEEDYESASIIRDRINAVNLKK